jgi:hypothetical protein
MSVTDALGSVTSTLPKVGVAVGALLAFAATFSLSFLTGLGSLVSAVVLLGIRGHMEERQLKIKLEDAAKQRQHEAERWQHEASESDKKRKHKAREGDKGRKKAVTLALINAGAAEAKLLTMTAA